jgi:hypothetical protein
VPNNRIVFNKKLNYLHVKQGFISTLLQLGNFKEL